MENPRYPWKTIVGLRLTALLALYGTFEFYGEQTDRNRDRKDPDKITRHVERFAPRNREVPPGTPVGSDVGRWAGGGGGRGGLGVCLLPGLVAERSVKHGRLGGGVVGGGSCRRGMLDGWGRGSRRRLARSAGGRLVLAVAPRPGCGVG